MAVRAADYPRLFQDSAHDPSEMTRNPIDPSSTDMLKVAEQTSDDLDLVPLVPMDEPRRNGADIDTTTGLPSKSRADGVSSAMAVAAPIAHYPVSTRAASPVSRPSQALYSHASPPRLEPTSRWKHVLIAVGFVVAAAVLAMVLWSVLVPRRGVGTEDDLGATAPAVSLKPAPKR